MERQRPQAKLAEVTIKVVDWAANVGEKIDNVIQSTVKNGIKIVRKPKFN